MFNRQTVILMKSLSPAILTSTIGQTVPVVYACHFNTCSRCSATKSIRLVSWHRVQTRLVGLDHRAMCSTRARSCSSVRCSRVCKWRLHGEWEAMTGAEYSVHPRGAFGCTRRSILFQPVHFFHHFSAMGTAVQRAVVFEELSPCHCCR